MTGQEEIAAMRSAGFGDSEIRSYVQSEAEKARAAGFTQSEIDKEYGYVQADTEKSNRGLATSVAGALASTNKNVFAYAAAPLEAALNVASGLFVGAPVGIIGGAGAAIRYWTGLTDEDPKSIMQRYADAVTYKPRTEGGQIMADTAMYPLQKLTQFSEYAGGEVNKKTGSAVAAGITEALLQVLPLVFLGSLGRRMAGKTPKPEDFQKTADALTGEYIAAGDSGTAIVPVTPKSPAIVEAKLRDVYEQTGIDPQGVYEASRTDPTIMQDLLSTNRTVPDSFVTAYHGSPYDFTKFDSSRIGTGEGAQAYGHGLYIAENPRVSAEYSGTKLAGTKPDLVLSTGEKFSYNTPVAQALIGMDFKTVAEAKARFAELEAEFKDGRFAKNLEVIKDLPDSAALNIGGLYSVRVPRSAVDAMLDWDKPLSEQPANVQAAIAASEFDIPAIAKLGGVSEPTGQQLYGAMIQIANKGKTGTAVDASARLKELGIPGIKYLDQGSRTAGEGTRNFVVFDENLIDITHKNGEPVSPVERTVTLEKMQPPEPPKDGGTAGAAGGGATPPPASSAAATGGGGKQPPAQPPNAGPPAYDPDYIRSRITAEPTKPWRSIRQFLDDIYTRVFDRMYPVPSAKQAAKMGVTFDEGIGPREALRLTAGATGKAKQFIENGTFDALTYADTGPSLRSVLKLADDDVKGFESYIVAKHAIEREAAGKATGIDLVRAQQEVDHGRAKFEAASQALTKYKDAVIDYAVKGSLIPVESVAAWKEAYKAHVPFYRLFEDEAGRGGRGKSPHNPVMAAKGSERLIIDPIVSIINDTYNFIALAESNMARQKMLGLPKDVIERVPDPIKPIKLQETEIQKLFDEFVTVTKKSSTQTTKSTTTTGSSGAVTDNKIVTMTRERVKDALTSRGFTDNEAETMLRRVAMGAAKDGSSIVETVIKEIEKTEYIPEIDIRVDDKVATVFRAMKAPVGPNEIVIMVDGKRQVYKVDKQVADAYNGLDPGSSDLLTGMASMLRAGVTLTPDFVMRNPVRDAVSAFVYAGAHPLNTAKGAISLFRQDAAYQNWLKGGGANAAMVSVDRNYLKEHLGLAQLDGDTHFMQTAWNYVKTPFEVMRIIGEVTENVTRIGAAGDIANAQTKAQIQALALIAREGTVDFSRRGSDPFLNMITRRAAFSNPALQGIDRMVRAFIDNPIGTTLKSFAAITIPSVLLWYANHDDEWTDPDTGIKINRWKTIPDWERDLFWIVLTKDHIFRIPKPFELGVLFGSVAERILDAYYDAKPEAFKHLGKSIANVFTFNITPTGLLPPVQHMTNFNFFTDRPLVSAADEKILPPYQYSPYTLETTKALAKIIGNTVGKESSFASPQIIDNYVRGWTGTLGPYAMQLADLGLRNAGVVPDPVRPTKALEDMPIIKAFMIRNPSMQAQPISDFYENYKKASIEADTIRTLQRRFDLDALRMESQLFAAKVERLEGIHKSLSTIRDVIYKVDQNPNATADEKRQIIDKLYLQSIQLATAGNEALRAIKQVRKEQATVH